MKWKYVLYSIGAVLLAVGGYIGYQLYNVNTTFNAIQNTENIETPAIEIDAEPFTVLLLGIDQTEGEQGRSDTIIVLSANPQTGTTKMLSIPRDTRTEIIGRGTTEKINHAYAYGGVKMTIDTVEHFLDMPIDYYATMNMSSFVDLVNIVGGITVNNDMELTTSTHHFPLGQIELNGADALAFSRIRYEDPRGDFGRQARQRQVIQALMLEAKNPATMLKFGELLQVAEANIQTNMSLANFTKLPALYSKLGSQIDMLQFESGRGEMIDGLWYYVVEQAEVEQLSKQLQNSAG